VSEDIEILRHRQARRAKLSIDPASGRVRLTLPYRAPLKPALRWAEEHKAWIEAQRARLPCPRPFVHGAQIPLGDECLTIDWAPERPRRVSRLENSLVVGGPADGLTRRVASWLRAESLRVLLEETVEVATRARVTIPSVRVADPKGRWGSCSSSGDIRYSWRLILAPRRVLRSTVAHEVAHRVHMDHSPAFHALAAELDPGDPAASRAWLRRHGAELHWFGRESAG
jgi:predicted metal-dependent hydrolase